MKIEYILKGLDCPGCAANLVVHLADRRLRCHHCGFTQRVPRACPECGNLDIGSLGRGTEQLEERLAGRFPRHGSGSWIGEDRTIIPPASTAGAPRVDGACDHQNDT